MKWLKLAWLNLGRNRRRSLATAVLIAIGVTGIMTTTGFALYTYESLQEFSMRENGQLILTHPQFFTDEEESPLEFGINNYQSIRQQLLQDIDIAYVLPSINFNGLITNGDKTTIFMGKGVDADLPKVMGPALNIEQGHSLSLYPDPIADYEVILGKALAKSLSAEIGSGLTLMSATTDGALNAIDVQVRGIVATGIPEMDARYLMIHNESAQLLLASDKVSQLSVYLRQPEQQNTYQQLFANTYADLRVTPWQDRAFFYKSVKDLYDRIFSVMGGVILMMVLFAVFNTNAMSVLERIREIGTLSALGTEQTEIKRLFAYESALLASIGSTFGFALSGLISLGLIVFDVQMPPPPGQTDGYPLQVYFSTEVASFTLLGILIIALAASLVALRKGTKINITEALRYA